MMKRLLAIITVFLAATSSQAATYYSAASGGSGTTCATGARCTLATGLGKLASGDTLILGNGTYTGTLIGSYGTDIPSGISATQRTTIRAENVGQAIIDGNYANPVMYHYDTDSRNYLEFDGIHFKRGSYGLFMLGGNYNYVHNCGFEDGGAAANNEEYPIVGITGSYTVVEDCWIWGKGRYGLYTSSVSGGSDHVIFRRNVVRLDAVPASRVSAAFRFYSGDTNTCQNCFAIDSRMDTAAESSVFTMGGSSSSAEPNHLWTDCIALNSYASGGTTSGFMTEDASATDTWHNSVIWDGNYRGFSTTGDSGSGTIAISNITVGEFSTAEIATNGSLTWNLSNSLVQVPSGATGFSNVDSVTNTLYYLDGGSRGDAVGTALTLANYNASLKYLPRIEPGSTAATAGVGATILYQQGTTGTYYGQTGWNTTSAIELWPLANEQMWSAKMAAYTATGPGGNRGFAALAGSTSYPLTNYIWNYLGSTPAIVTPSDIYGAEGDTTPATTAITSTDPLNVSVSSATVTATCADETAVSGSKWAIGVNPDATHGTACDGTTSASCSVTGLSSGNNDVRVACYDSSGNYDASPGTLTVNYTPPAVTVGLVGGMCSGCIIH